jgi:hypothetical protein
MPLHQGRRHGCNQPEGTPNRNRNLGSTIEPVRFRLEEGEIVARVQNISVTGIGLLTRQPLEPGTWLILEPAEPSRYLPSELRAEVRFTRKLDEEDYLAGCCFSRLLTQEDVMVLG